MRRASVKWMLRAVLVIATAGCWPAPPLPDDTPAAPPLCDANVPTRLGVVGTDELTETSGLVASRHHPGVLWAHNDSGDAARIFALRRDGTVLGVYPVADASAVDWEDIAIGPGVASGQSALYIGDIGDNARVRDEIQVYRVPEPTLLESTALQATRLRFRYPDGPHDAEALLVDPLTGDLYVVSKATTGRSGVYRASAPLAAGPTTLTKVSTLKLASGSLVTAVDVSVDGTQVALRTYGSIRVYKRRATDALFRAFRSAPCTPIAPPELQGETIAIDLGGRGYVTISEGLNPPIFHGVG